MNMIRHDYVTANGNVEVTPGTFGISDKRCVDFIAGEILLSQVSAKGDKIERACIKQTTETWRAVSEILLHHEPVATALWPSNQKDLFGRSIDRPQAGGYKISETAAGRGIASPVQTKAPCRILPAGRFELN